MLLVKKTFGSIFTFLAAFIMVVGVGRTQAAGTAASPLQLPLILGLVCLFGGIGIWLLFSKPNSSAAPH